MEITITTLVLIEDTSIQEGGILYHSMEDDIEKAKQDILHQVNMAYTDFEKPDLQFKSIEDIKNKGNFDYVSLESQRLKLTNHGTTIKTYNIC